MSPFPTRVHAFLNSIKNKIGHAKDKRNFLATGITFTKVTYHCHPNTNNESFTGTKSNINDADN